MMRMLTKPLFAVLLATAAPVAAQAPSMPAFPPLVPIAAPHVPNEIPLETGGVPGAVAPESWFSIGGKATARNVVRATLTPVLPDPDKATGAAVIVAPGGAFLMLSMDNEGWPVARWLADHGIAAFVLKYRLDPTPADLSAFDKAVAARMGAAVTGPGQQVNVRTPPEAIADGAAAVRLVRQRAHEWGVDPTRVGFLGFSAGAMTALQVALHAPAGEKPDFVAPIYGPMSAVDVPTDAPPMFAAIAADDPLFGNSGYALIDSWHHAGKPVELHVYQAGGHGFGMGAAGTTSGDWITSFYHWMSVNGWLKPHR
jgi:acetyl esterase/lipase